MRGCLFWRVVSFCCAFAFCRSGFLSCCVSLASCCVALASFLTLLLCRSRCLVNSGLLRLPFLSPLSCLYVVLRRLVAPELMLVY